MSEKTTKFLETLSDEQLVMAIAEGNQMLKQRFADAKRHMEAVQKQMLSVALSGRKPRVKKERVDAVA